MSEQNIQSFPFVTINNTGTELPTNTIGRQSFWVKGNPAPLVDGVYLRNPDNTDWVMVSTGGITIGSTLPVSATQDQNFILDTAGVLTLYAYNSGAWTPVNDVPVGIPVVSSLPVTGVQDQNVILNTAGVLDLYSWNSGAWIQVDLNASSTINTITTLPVSGTLGQVVFVNSGPGSNNNTIQHIWNGTNWVTQGRRVDFVQLTIGANVINCTEESDFHTIDQAGIGLPTLITINLEPTPVDGKTVYFVKTNDAILANMNFVATGGKTILNAITGIPGLSNTIISNAGVVIKAVYYAFLNTWVVTP